MCEGGACILVKRTSKHASSNFSVKQTMTFYSEARWACTHRMFCPSIHGHKRMLAIPEEAYGVFEWLRSLLGSICGCDTGTSTTSFAPYQSQPLTSSGCNGGLDASPHVISRKTQVRYREDRSPSTPSISQSIPLADKANPFQILHHFHTPALHLSRPHVRGPQTQK